MKIGEIVKYVYRKYTFKVKMKPEHGFILKKWVVRGNCKTLLEMFTETEIYEYSEF